MSRSGRIRVWILVATGLLLMSIAATLMMAAALVTGFRARRLYATMATRTARAILRTWGIRVIVRKNGPFPAEQTIFISNHTSTLDLFVLVALGLPNTRFFLSGFLRKYGPLGVIAWLMGTFFTVPQDRPAERARIFARADRILRRTRESVYLSPEGGRITTGEIGHFNKGAFHLAASLKAPIVPMYFFIPPDINPGLGLQAAPGTVEVFVMPAVETSAWRVEDSAAYAEAVRTLFVGWHREYHSNDGKKPHAAIPVPIAC